MQIKNAKLEKIEYLYLFFLLLFYFSWAASKPFNYAPDEFMRYAVTEFLYYNNRLPVGTELLSANWGFSYAHMPTVLCNLLGYVFMKIAGIFTQDAFDLLVAARLASVCCGVGTIYFVMKTAKLLFPTPVHWIMVVFISMIPQFAFLTSYVNNDIVALFGASMILYCWVFAMKTQWDKRIATLLAIGISVCALSYYNSYGWILCSIFFFIGSYLLQNSHDYKGMFKLGFFIATIVLILISPLFIRHLVLYGDLLGRTTANMYNELYGIESLKPSNRVTLIEQGLPFSWLLFNHEWWKISYLSFIGYFGYMSIPLNGYVYNMYSFLFLFTFLGAFYSLLSSVLRTKSIGKDNVLFGINILLTMMIPVFLSLWYSYTSDYQPQGRYCYSMVFGLAITINYAVSNFTKIIKSKERIYAFIGIFVATIITLTISEFFVTYIPV